MTPPKTRTALVIGTGALAAVLTIAAAYFAGRPQPLTLPTQGRPAVGRADAPTLVIFEDYKCPACQAFTQETLPGLEARARAGEVRLVFMHRPFLAPDSRAAAIAAECVWRTRPEAFLTFHKALYAAQGDERVPWATAPLLSRVARGAGAGGPAWPRCLNSPAAAAAVDADNAAFLRGKARYTPAFYLGGNLIVRPSVAGINRAIDQARTP
ncbi:DsbA family protein [Deinococcus petrolearius]|uniref:DsbA family protein n=1 Tax=Deinococcus petrolearius TaxID=1751295 RepID=A0ABW1DLG9_9DEIO